jgi:cytochrome b6-f complex iron-sulfur subunit
VRRRKRGGDPLVDAIAEGERLPGVRVEDPQDVEALRAAIELKAAAPAADLPSEAFVASLRQEIADQRAPEGQRRLSRRALVGVAGAAAAGAAAVAITVDRTLLVADPDAGRGGVLDPIDAAWVPVGTEGDVAGGTPHRFATDKVIGFVTDVDDDLAAVSATCTHLGCILQQNDVEGRLDCPCHRTAFAYDGRVLFAQLPTAPPPLVRLQVRRRDGNVEVLVPRPS